MGRAAGAGGPLAQGGSRCHWRPPDGTSTVRPRLPGRGHQGRGVWGHQGSVQRPRTPIQYTLHGAAPAAPCTHHDKRGRRRPGWPPPPQQVLSSGMSLFSVGESPRRYKPRPDVAGASSIHRGKPKPPRDAKTPAGGAAQPQPRCPPEALQPPEHLLRSPASESTLVSLGSHRHPNRFTWGTGSASLNHTLPPRAEARAAGTQAPAQPLALWPPQGLLDAAQTHTTDITAGPERPRVPGACASGSPTARPHWGPVRPGRLSRAGQPPSRRAAGRQHEHPGAWPGPPQLSESSSDLLPTKGHWGPALQPSPS